MVQHCKTWQGFAGLCRALQGFAGLCRALQGERCQLYPIARKDSEPCNFPLGVCLVAASACISMLLLTMGVLVGGRGKLWQAGQLRTFHA